MEIKLLFPYILLASSIVGLIAGLEISVIAKKTPNFLYDELKEKQPSLFVTPLLVSALTIITVNLFGDELTTVPLVIFVWLLITIAIIDIDHQIVLDFFSYPLIWSGLLFSLYSPLTSPESAILGAAFGYGILWVMFQLFYLFTSKEGMGFGDFKLMAGLGAWLGVESIPIIYFVSSVSGIVFMFIKIKFFSVDGDRQPTFAFAPFLVLGGLIYLYFQDYFLFTY